MRFFPSIPVLAAMLFYGSTVFAAGLPQASAALFAEAQKQPDYGTAASYAPSIVPTSDGKSFILIWKPQGPMPKKWIVSLHGNYSYATQSFATWSHYLKDRHFGFIAIQWWLGDGDLPTDYYDADTIYRELGYVLQQMKVTPGNALLEGYSYGTTNLYPIAALDHVKGARYFGLYLPNSGAVVSNSPPIMQLRNYGRRPYNGTNWIPTCGYTDPEPERDGCAGMQKTAKWIARMGGKVVMSIEDPREGSGAFYRNPANAKQVLDYFESMP